MAVAVSEVDPYTAKVAADYIAVVVEAQTHISDCFCLLGYIGCKRSEAVEAAGVVQSMTSCSMEVVFQQAIRVKEEHYCIYPAAESVLVERGIDPAWEVEVVVKEVPLVTASRSVSRSPTAEVVPVEVSTAASLQGSVLLEAVSTQPAVLSQTPLSISPENRGYSTYLDTAPTQQDTDDTPVPGDQHTVPP